MLVEPTDRIEELAGSSLQLLGGFEIVVGGSRPQIPRLAQRLVAFLALRGERVDRSHAAAVLSPDVDHHHALANLRTALWRLRSAAPDAIESRGPDLRFGSATSVDIRDSEALAHLVIEGRLSSPEARDASMRLSLDLLPDWGDEWLVFERERFRDLRVRALERLCEQLSAAGDHADAVQCGLLAVHAEPLRESAHRALMRAHIAEGNRARALLQFRALERQLEMDLQVAPSQSTIELARQMGLTIGGPATPTRPVSAAR